MDSRTDDRADPTLWASRSASAPTPIPFSLVAGIKPVVVDGVVRSDGTTILGSDNKQSVAAILEAVQTVLESGLPHRAFDVLFTWGEEKGHLGAHSVDLGSLTATSTFVFDAGDEIGTIITETPTSAWMVATFHGKAAHAGIEPERGINAIQAAAIAISKMRLGRLDADTTANVGLIEGGTVRNAVPAKAVVQMETRSMRPDACEEQVAAMKAACRGRRGRPSAHRSRSRRASATQASGSRRTSQSCSPPPTRCGEPASSRDLDGPAAGATPTR